MQRDYKNPQECSEREVMRLAERYKVKKEDILHGKQDAIHRLMDMTNEFNRIMNLSEKDREIEPPSGYFDWTQHADYRRTFCIDVPIPLTSGKSEVSVTVPFLSFGRPGQRNVCLVTRMEASVNHNNIEPLVVRTSVKGITEEYPLYPFNQRTTIATPEGSKTDYRMCVRSYNDNSRLRIADCTPADVASITTPYTIDMIRQWLQNLDHEGEISMDHKDTIMQVPPQYPDVSFLLYKEHTYIQRLQTDEASKRKFLCSPYYYNIDAATPQSILSMEGYIVPKLVIAEMAREVNEYVQNIRCIRADDNITFTVSTVSGNPFKTHNAAIPAYFLMSMELMVLLIPPEFLV